ncbi:protein ALWAYS EARLY 2-like isoform X1 [Raphanus sativus]|uniref:Protein ALWAYS EARLY 2-like isoform X1 n=1 Tax=Raphanus sativus TaxID=3726 RepID=A0A9W3DR63_RAPSA|nr:protein ALWAYS EARLY 2-like isoform X1 [Raphanus sativus]XP_056866313.1 protein ALWAYS EARLY 2-like isoform X1 [Raphanus sativus]XP_056866314.1 protein ALWAYS EARLY 2-like isoform X1 [Raphanus sativus]XP_056866315.1 protein ALWAYS EARLY 2-like isoform X1 [Raphanus sativus]
MIAPILHGKVSTNISSSPHQTNQPCIVNCSKGRESEIQRALALQHALDEKEMEPEMLKIVKGSKTRVQAMVDAAIKAASSCVASWLMIQEPVNLILKHTKREIKSSYKIKSSLQDSSSTSMTSIPEHTKREIKSSYKILSPDTRTMGEQNNLLLRFHLCICFVFRFC